MQTIDGWRYVVEIPMGFSSAQFVSRELYPSQGAAIDAMTKAYPEAEYPDADRRIMPDEEIVSA